MSHVCSLEGPVPNGFGDPPAALTYLDLSSNLFSGSLPTNWSDSGLSNLTQLYTYHDPSNLSPELRAPKVDGNVNLGNTRGFLSSSLTRTRKSWSMGRLLFTLLPPSSPPANVCLESLSNI